MGCGCKPLFPDLLALLFYFVLILNLHTGTHWEIVAMRGIRLCHSSCTFKKKRAQGHLLYYYLALAIEGGQAMI